MCNDTLCTIRTILDKQEYSSDNFLISSSSENHLSTEIMIRAQKQICGL